MTTISKSDEVKRIVLEGIRTGEYPVGACIPSDNELTTITGLSRTTVRDAVAQLVSAGYLERIQGKGTYVLNPTDTHTVQSSSIALLVTDHQANMINNPFIDEIILGVHRYLSGKGTGVNIYPMEEVQTVEAHIAGDKIPDAWKGGVILTGSFSQKANITYLQQHGIPCVSIGRPLCSCDIPYVDADHFAGSYLGTEHLIKLGHRDILHIDYPLDSAHFLSVSDRYHGVSRALLDNGIAVNPELQLTCNELKHDTVAGQIAAKIDSGIKFTAVLVYGNTMFTKLLEELRKRNLEVPKDISVVYNMGYTKMWESYRLIPTAVLQPLREMGYAAAEMLFTPPGTTESRIFRPKLNIGATCRNI